MRSVEALNYKLRMYYIEQFRILPLRHSHWSALAVALGCVWCCHNSDHISDKINPQINQNMRCMSDVYARFWRILSNIQIYNAVWRDGQYFLIHNARCMGNRNLLTFNKHSNCSNTSWISSSFWHSPHGNIFLMIIRFNKGENGKMKSTE
jgi:hypothetical protein